MACVPVVINNYNDIQTEWQGEKVFNEMRTLSNNVYDIIASGMNPIGYKRQKGE